MDHNFSKAIAKYKYQFMNFLNILSLNSFVLQPVTHREIRKIISVKQTKSSISNKYSDYSSSRQHFRFCETYDSYLKTII